MESGPDLDVEYLQRVSDRRGGLNGTGRSIEGGEESVAGRVQLLALEPRELATDDRVMSLEELAPRRVADSRRQLGRAYDVGEENCREYALRAGRPG